MLYGMKPTPENIMISFRYLEPARRYTICSAVRDVYATTTDPKTKEILRYIEMLAKVIVKHVEELDPEWLKHVYPLRREYDKLMKDII
jgi:hypothetical protein